MADNDNQTDLSVWQKLLGGGGPDTPQDYNDQQSSGFTPQNVAGAVAAHADTPEGQKKKTFKDHLGDFMKGFGGGFMNAYNAQMNPRLFQEQQENQRQQAQLAQQARLHQMMTPYEQASLDMQGRKDEENRQQQSFENQLKLANGIATGGLEQVFGPQATAQFDKNAPGQDILSSFGLGSATVPGYTNPASVIKAGGIQAVPNQDLFQEKTVPFTIPDTWKKFGFTPGTINVPANNLPNFIDSAHKLNTQIDSQKLQSSLHDQIQSLYPNDDAMAGQVQSVVDNQLAMGDTKGAQKTVLDAIHRHQTFEDKYGKATTDAKAAQAGAIKSAQNKAVVDQAMEENKDVYPYLVKQLDSGALKITDIQQRFHPEFMTGLYKYMQENGKNFPVALSQAAQSQLARFGPVREGLLKVREFMNSNDPRTGKPYKDSNTMGEFALDRLMYSMGMDRDDMAQIISLNEFNDLRGAARITEGLSRASGVLGMGMVHTPNFKIDSGKMINDKIETMLDTINSQEKNWLKYGTRTGVVPQDVKPPAKFIVKDGKVIVNPDFKGQ